MASIVLRIDDRVCKNGMSPVRIRVSHCHTAAWYQTGVMLEPSCFQTASVYDPVSRRAYMAAEKREQLAGLVRSWDEGLFELQRSDGGGDLLSRMTATELRDYIFGAKPVRAKASELVTKRRNADSASDFMVFLDKYAQSRVSVRTQEHVAYVWRVLCAYVRERSLLRMTFADITYERLTDIKSWMRSKGKGEQARFKVESYVRAAYREGLRMGMCDRAHDPFLDYRIERVPEKDIVTISREQMKMLMEYDKRPGLQRAKDVLLASFYLCGANFIDLYDMRDPVDGEVRFVRHKVQRRTQKETRIRVEPELAVIVGRYGGNGRLLNFAANMRSLQYNLNDNYRELSKELGFKVNLEIIRRTWATLAGELECPEIVIDKSMGHITRSVTSRYYEQYDWSRTARWNRRVIDYVRGCQNPM